jgi:hypothetical protein
MQRRVEVRITYCWTFTGAELRKRLCLPDDARLTVRVPIGGDWSGTDLDLEDIPLMAMAPEKRSKDES